MTRYTITTKGYETGLTANALKAQIRDSFEQDLEIIVEEMED